jgi:uroporphyrinogen decarboxylase
MGFNLQEKHVKAAERIVSEVQSKSQLAPVDLKAFWSDNKRALEAPWSPDCPQMPLGIQMPSECAFAELGVPENRSRLFHDSAYRLGLNKRYNDLSEQAVGIRFLPEQSQPGNLKWPEIKGLHDLFEARNEWHSESYWLRQSANTPDELSALLDRVDDRLENLHDILFPSNWEDEKKRLKAEGQDLPLQHGLRGPITFAMSVYGVENLIFLILDHPSIAKRFRDTITRALLERARIIDEEAGYTPETVPHGWTWADDNCCNLTADMYEFFGSPILESIFDRYSPEAEDIRGQHSDSAMAHLLPLLGRLDLTWTNFGPTLSVSEIRHHLPNAIIYGQLAPFTFSRNEEVNMVAETLRDFEMSKEKRGVVFQNAGSINNGSMLNGLRLIMHTIQNHCRY